MEYNLKAAAAAIQEFQVKQAIGARSKMISRLAGLATPDFNSSAVPKAFQRSVSQLRGAAGNKKLDYNVRREAAHASPLVSARAGTVWEPSEGAILTRALEAIYGKFDRHAEAIAKRKLNPTELARYVPLPTPPTPLPPPTLWQKLFGQPGAAEYSNQRAHYLNQMSTAQTMGRLQYRQNMEKKLWPRRDEEWRRAEREIMSTRPGGAGLGAWRDYQPWLDDR